MQKQQVSQLVKQICEYRVGQVVYYAKKIGKRIEPIEIEIYRIQLRLDSNGEIQILIFEKGYPRLPYFMGVHAFKTIHEALKS